MLTYLIHLGCFAMAFLCIPGIAKSQTNNTTTDKNFPRINLISSLSDSVSPSERKRNLFPAFQQRQFPGPGSTFNSRTFIGSLNPGVNFKSPFIKINHADLSDHLSNNSSSADNMQDQMLNSGEMKASISVFNVPFEFNYNNNTGWQTEADHFRAGAAKFDRESFLNNLRDRIRKVTDPEQLFASALNGLYAKRDMAIASIRNDLAELLKSSNEKLFRDIETKINSENISRQGIDQFLEHILQQNDAHLHGIQNKIQTPTASDDVESLNTQIASTIKSREQIEMLRSKWHRNGVAQIINGFEKEKLSVINKLLSDPAEITKIAASKLKLRGLEKFLLNSRTLNFGSSGINQSSLGLKDALLKGVSAEFLKGKNFLAPVLGSQPGIKNITDLFYSNAGSLANIFSGGMSLGKGDPQKQFSQVSVFLYQQNNNQLLSNGFQSALPKNLVATISKKISLGGSHSLLAEVSKSTSLYSNAGEAGVKNIINRENLLGNMGVNINYSGELESVGISENLVVRYTGKEYSNLGNYAMVSGSREISNDLKKYFLKRKLVLSLRAHYREYEFSVDDRKWKSLSYLADVKWRLKRGEFLELRYQPYFNRRTSVSENYLSSESHRLSVRGNMNRKVGRGLTYRNFLELGSSKDNFYDVVADRFIANRMTSFTSLQSLNIGRQSLFINLTGNIANTRTDYLYSNSSLSVDGGMTFNSFRNVYLSSSLVYNEVNGMYSQLGVRQALSVLVGKNLSLDGYLNVGKNLYKLDYIQVPAVTGNLSVSYNLK